MSTVTLPVKLDALTFPLHGNRLIEASAGTGKTYTIANLYLRLILGHGDDNTRYPVPLGVDSILVVTFTDAATAELRDRIRARIHNARLDFLVGHSGDTFIQQLIDDLDHHEERIALLLAAERQMDEAAVFTIHGFCQRMLKQHAFESGTLFSSELITDETALLQQTTADFWRRTLYPINKPTAEISRRLWKTPNDLLQNIRGWLGQNNLEVVRGQLPDSIEQFQKQYIDPVLAIKQRWKDEQETIETLIRTGGLKKNAKPLNRLTEMADFVHSTSLKPTLKAKESWEVFSTESLTKATTKAGTVPEHPVFHLIDELLNNSLDLTKAFEGMILSEALADVKRRMTHLKKQRHQMSFDDLLGNLAKALLNDHAGLLALAIREQFPIAMIDEFQDTDPQQYHIFNQIYANTEISLPKSDSGLFMIGDPKQAIYAFRGADIFTYMQAREQVSAHYTLDTNWRSTRNMVKAANRMFSLVEAPFIYDAIPFTGVSPSPNADNSRLLHLDKPMPALQFWLHENGGNAVGNGDYEAAMTEATAHQVNTLLTAAQRNECQLEKKGDRSPLQAGDIAVLVRTSRQGQMIRQALSQLNIASVYLSNRESVFSCQEAVDIQRLLTACLSPTNERILRAALATPLLAMTAKDLDAMNQDEHVWESAVEEFSGYLAIWQKHGVLPMLRQLITQRKIAERLLPLSDGERRLTDVLHLGELLASVSQELETPHALLRWLREHTQDPDNNADDQQLHLESERNLVQIVTIHKSKGLEYNVVFLPFACNFRDAEFPVYHEVSADRTSHNLLNLSGQEGSLIKADKERLAEDLRLMYVAITRAVHCCYIGIAPLKKGSGKKSSEKKDDKTDLHRTAIGNLLSKKNEISTSQLAEILDNLNKEHDFINVSPPPSEPMNDFSPVEIDTNTLKHRTFTGKIQKDWWVTSYSALSKSAHGSYNSSPKKASPNATEEQPGVDIEVQEQSAIKPENPTNEMTIFTFPRGARPGTFMHTLFERLTPNNSTPEKLPDYINEQLQLEGLSEEWCDTLVNMLQNCLTAPLLKDQKMTLGGLPETGKKVEMEFYLPLSPVRASQLNQILVQHDPLSRQASELSFGKVQGMLKGFIDLVFEYQGRWYVLDYKSNWLGEQYSDYSHSKMEQVMVNHRYDLQYQLYTLALHRLLKNRVPDYDYDEHFGGVIYLFLRGVQCDDPDHHGIYDTRPEKELIEAMDALFSGEFAGEVA